MFQGVHMLLQFSSSAEGVGRPWREGEKRLSKVRVCWLPRVYAPRVCMRMRAVA